MRRLLSRVEFLRNLWVGCAASVAVLSFGAGAREVSARQDTPVRRDVDMLVSWEPDWIAGYSERSKLPNVLFYVNDRFVGYDEAGMKAVIERVRGLPERGSVVWGADPDKIGSGSGSERITPQVKFPKLWDEFVGLKGQRGVTFSTRSYAHMRGRELPRPFDFLDGNRDTLYVEPAEPPRAGEIVLTCRRGAEEGLINYSVNGRAAGKGPRGFFDAMQLLRTLPAGSRLRLSRQDEADISKQIDREGYYYFQTEFGELVRNKQFRCVMERDKKHWPKWFGRPAQCRWDWCNFRAEDAPPQEVIYRVDGKAVGMGDRGFEAVLAHLRTLPKGAYVEYPQYVIRGRGLPSREVREAFKARDLVPFALRRKDLADVIQQGELVVERAERPPFAGAYTNYSYHDGWKIESLLEVARIVRYDERPSEAAANLTWKQEPRPGKKAAVPPAQYFINGEATGQGTAGFLAALKRLEQLPDGSVVRIDPVAVATRGPFRNAIVVAGHRHFEFTHGGEPFREFLDLLIEVAQRKRLKLELIPDEGTRFQVENA